MISKEEIEKLTVTQIKEKLKSRKLSIAGTKPDLVVRLYENILAEEKLLGTAGLESAGPSDFDLDNVDVDEVLGLLDNEPSLSSPDQQQKKKNPPAVKPTTKPAPIITPTAKTIEEAKHTVDVEQPSAVPKKEPKKPIAPPAGVAPTKTAVKANGKAEETTTTTTVTTTDAGVDKKTSGLSSEEEQKMLNRAKRLGLPVGATAIAATTTTPAASTEDTLKKRAERFGPVSDEEAKKQARMQRFGQVTNSPVSTAVSAIAKDEALQKRAQRFGLPVGGVTNGANDDVKKQARAQRFGPLVSDSIAVKRPAGASAEQLASLEKRAKRFGVTSGN